MAFLYDFCHLKMQIKGILMLKLMLSAKFRLHKFKTDTQTYQTKHLVYCLKVFSRCICSRVSLVSLLLYIAAPPTFYQIFMINGLFQKTKVEFHD